MDLPERRANNAVAIFYKELWKIRSFVSIDVPGVAGILGPSRVLTDISMIQTFCLVYEDLDNDTNLRGLLCPDLRSLCLVMIQTFTVRLSGKTTQTTATQLTRHASRDWSYSHSSLSTMLRNRITSDACGRAWTRRFHVLSHVQYSAVCQVSARNFVETLRKDTG